MSRAFLHVYGTEGARAVLLWTDIAQQVVLFLLQLALTSFIVLIHRLTPTIRRWVDCQSTATERRILSLIGSEAVAFARNLHGSASEDEILESALTYATNVTGMQKLNITADELRAVIHMAWQTDK